MARKVHLHRASDTAGQTADRNPQEQSNMRNFASQFLSTIAALSISGVLFGTVLV